jgi:hypothetical protein
MHDKLAHWLDYGLGAVNEPGTVRYEMAGRFLADEAALFLHEAGLGGFVH